MGNYGGPMYIKCIYTLFTALIGRTNNTERRFLSSSCSFFFFFFLYYWLFCPTAATDSCIMCPWCGLCSSHDCKLELLAKTYTRSHSKVPPGLWAGVCVQGGRGGGGGNWHLDKGVSISCYPSVHSQLYLSVHSQLN